MVVPLAKADVVSVFSVTVVEVLLATCAPLGMPVPNTKSLTLIQVVLEKVKTKSVDVCAALVALLTPWVFTPRYLFTRIPVPPMVNISDMRRSINL
jgi:hypothetical protein